jgi:hypothetical protein
MTDMLQTLLDQQVSLPLVAIGIVITIGLIAAMTASKA